MQVDKRNGMILLKKLFRLYYRKLLQSNIEILYSTALLFITKSNKLHKTSYHIIRILEEKKRLRKIIVRWYFRDERYIDSKRMVF